jgi:hypothetical protein
MLMATFIEKLPLLLIALDVPAPALARWQAA